MKHSIGALFAFATSASLLTACGSGNTSFPPGTGNNCGLPPIQLEVLYPIPDSRRAPGNLRKVYVATNGALPNYNSYNFYLVRSNGSNTATSPLFGSSKSELPTRHAKPTFANAVYYASSIPSGFRIGRSQSVKLLWNIPGSGCTPHSAVSSFRTRGVRS
jgi:hypothetical protein